MLNQTGNTENSYLYTGEQYDANLDNYYLRARYYNQSVGRFTQQDTYMGRNQEPLTLHKYLYTHANPVNGTDPTGLFNMAEVSASNNIVGIQSVGSVGRVGLVSFAANDAVIAGTATASSRQIGLFVLSGLGAAGAKLFDMLRDKEDDEQDEVVNYYRAVETGEMVDILDCSCFRFLDRGFGVEPTAIKRFFLQQSSAVSFGYSFLLGDFPGANNSSFFVVNAKVSKGFDSVIASLPGGSNPGDAHIGQGRAVPLALLPALNAEANKNGGIQMTGEYQ